MFERPPDFIIPLWTALANITTWFDWGALEAIGTVGALWFAVVQSTRTARSERAARIGTLTTLIGLTEPITEGVPQFDDREDDLLDPKEIDYLLDARNIVQRGIDGLARLSLSDISAVGAAEYVGALSLSLGYLTERLPKKLSDPVRASHLNDLTSYVGEACDFFIEQRDYLKYGWLGSRWNKLYREMDHRYWHWRVRRYQRRAAKAAPRPATRATKE